MAGSLTRLSDIRRRDAPNMLMGPRGAATAPGEREITITDARFPSGHARLLAWNVVMQGQQDLSTWLCRCASGRYYLLCRSGNRPELPYAVVSLSPERAAAWFAVHPR
ncbi:MAG TPA: hypothetical protein VMM78_11845, partial [Thermomicrobiales bacterium]|nr:hypothetical protein [Thermomicrobiales bacterium]